jgi:hypothetical protein
MEEVKKDTKIEEAKKIVDKMVEDKELNLIEEMIKDNKATFIYKDKHYRVRLLNIKEKEELDNLRRKKFGQLIQDKDILLEKDLIEVYKGRGIDIEEIKNQIKKLESEQLDLQLKLGAAESKNEGETVLKTYHDKIAESMYKIKILSTQITLLLEFSLENQLLNYVAQVITYLSLDEIIDGEWKRIFNSLEDFQNYSDVDLINKASIYSMALQYI